MSFQIIPAIDLREGRVVRLRQGDYARQTRYADDALALAASYCEAGAACLHVVDLDGARAGACTQLELIARMAALLPVQAGGGVRSEEDVRRLFDAGVARVVVGSIAVRDPQRVLQWLQTYGSERLVLALDAREQAGVWRLPVAGWTEDGGATLDARVQAYAAGGARHLLCTDIARDGMLAGINTALYAHLQMLAPALAVQASGGVRDLDDIRAARAAGAAGVILGRALLEGRFTLQEALSC